LQDGLLGRLPQSSTDPRRIEAEPCLGAVAEPHRAEVVGVVVDEIPADSEPSSDLGGVNQLAAGLTRSQQIGHPSCHGLYVRIAEGHRLLLLSVKEVVCIGHLHRISPKTPANAPGNSWHLDAGGENNHEPHSQAIPSQINPSQPTTTSKARAK
jgi:hypothetical protein